jgi:hypothetical protein
VTDTADAASRRRTLVLTNSRPFPIAFTLLVDGPFAVVGMLQASAPPASAGAAGAAAAGATRKLPPSGTASAAGRSLVKTGTAPPPSPVRSCVGRGQRAGRCSPAAQSQLARIIAAPEGTASAELATLARSRPGARPRAAPSVYMLRPSETTEVAFAFDPPLHAFAVSDDSLRRERTVTGELRVCFEGAPEQVRAPGLPCCPV